MINLNLIPPVLKKEILETWGKSDEQPTLADLPYVQLGEIQKSLYYTEDQEVCEGVEEVLGEMSGKDIAFLIKTTYFQPPLAPFGALKPFTSYLNVELEEAWETWGGEQS